MRIQRRIACLGIIISIALPILHCKEENQMGISSQEKGLLEGEIGSVVFMIKGNVSVYDETGRDIPLKAKETKLFANHNISTAEKSSLDLLLYDGSIIRVYQKTKLSLSNILASANNTQESKIRLNTGRIFVKTGKLPKDRNVIVETASTVAGVRGTEFIVIEEEEEKKILVGEGSVEGEKIDGSVSENIDAGQKMEYRDGELQVDPMTEEESREYQQESQTVATTISDGKQDIARILQDFQSEKTRILETIDKKKLENKELIEDQKNKNKELIQEQKEKDKQRVEKVKEKTKSEMDKVKEGSKSEMDRIKSGLNK